MYEEAELLPLSGIQHLVFCERQCALIHVEGLWKENILTAEGRLLHERSDSAESETRGNIRIERGVPLRSMRLGLAGKADVVELHQIESEPLEHLSPGLREAVPLRHVSGVWRPVPVEYKRGEPKYTDCDRAQLCAQALCLEEMLGVYIPEGWLFYGRPRRRFKVAFGADIRAKTEGLARKFHDLVNSERTPLVHRQRKCQNCSLIDLCLPPPRRHRRSTEDYLRLELWKPLAENAP